MAATECDFGRVVLGGAPAGCVTAIHPANVGLAVCLADQQAQTGLFGSWGCIPSKALLKTAKSYRNLNHLAPFN